MAISTERAAAMVLNFRPEVVELVREAGLESAKTARLPAARIASLLLHRGDAEGAADAHGCHGGFHRYGACAANYACWPNRLSSPVDGPMSRLAKFITRRLGHEILEKSHGAVHCWDAGGGRKSGQRRSCPAHVSLHWSGAMAVSLPGFVVNRILRRRTACTTGNLFFLWRHGNTGGDLGQNPRNQSAYRPHCSKNWFASKTAGRPRRQHHMGSESCQHAM